METLISFAILGEVLFTLFTVWCFIKYEDRFVAFEDRLIAHIKAKCKKG